ncbi:glycosyltransferase family 2 protein [Bacillus cereus]|uniref:Glycosyltransferase family 2 protein n=2 Tax=Bacillus cereus group TaxID=86661 RepID=A0AAW7NEV1_BACCE|nr:MULTISPECIES: glycosyltransferase family 2 protein [Bacillus cereus group]MDN4873007.1 glycosyltransferase family 2 protein [Bacillus cereus]MDZ5475616.1 glycosyltransferase family 2 protein [Bacillus thuringiensis]MRB33270.1 hypothetical protein [Bacillus thuringiensis]WHT91519.1 glycosyltransferase family 2 protein [Bacillus cereus]
MKVLITMAGRGQRFLNKGFTIPKYMINVQNKSLFYWSISSLKDFFEYEFIFMAVKEHNCVNFIKRQCELLGIDNYKIIELNSFTCGQAETAYNAKNYINVDEQVMIYNIDTFVDPNSLKKIHFKNNDGIIPVFETFSGDNWSYVKLNSFGRVVEVAEKKKISNYASIGLYYFRKWDYFLNSYERNKTSILQQYKEIYIAPLYNEFIQKLNVGIHEIPKGNIIPLGTPEEVEVFENLVQ